MPIKLITVSLRWFVVVYNTRTIPRSLFEADGRVSSTSAITYNVSQGRTGVFQRTSSRPGEPRLDADRRA